MSENTFKASGTCLCGNVTYTTSLKAGAGACHCAMCRKWSGGPYMAVHATGKVIFHGEQHIGRYSSSPWAERGFCKNCGSNLFYYLLPRPNFPDGAYMLSAGSVADQNKLIFDNEVFVNGAPGWYRFTDEESRERLTEADIMAKYGGDN